MGDISDLAASINDIGLLQPGRLGIEQTAYCLRHSSIVRSLIAGTPTRVVAALHDTSTSSSNGSTQPSSLTTPTPWRAAA